jgi:hypothetical protein
MPTTWIFAKLIRSTKAAFACESSVYGASPNWDASILEEQF